MLSAAQKLILWQIYVAGNTVLGLMKSAGYFCPILTKSAVSRRM